MKTLRRRMKQRVSLMVQSFKGELTKRMLGNNVSALVVNAEDRMYAVDPEDFGVGGALRRYGAYGSHEVDRLRPFLTGASRALVVGAHIGTLVVPLSRLCQQVVAIEANPATYRLLRMNLALNDVHNCQPINLAASDKEETLEFLASRANSGGSKRVPKISQYMYYYDHPQTITVKAVALDQHLNDKNFDVVLMDIEGSEYFALCGMQQILARCKVLVVEFLPHHLRNVSGISVEQFLAPIQRHFDRLTIPSRGISVEQSQFLDCLTGMFNREESDEGILFEKSRSE